MPPLWDRFTKRWRRQHEDPTLYPDLKVESKHQFTFKREAAPKPVYKKRGTLAIAFSRERRLKNRARARVRSLVRRRLPHGRARGTK